MTEYEKILSSPLIVKNGYIRVHSYAGGSLITIKNFTMTIY